MPYGWRHGARGTAPHHRHHRRRRAQRRLLCPCSRPAPRGQDGQPGRPHRLPPLLRRRAGTARVRADLLRVSRRGAWPRGGGECPPDRVARRRAGGDRLLARSPRRGGRRRRGRRGGAAVRRPGGPRARAAGGHGIRRAAGRRAPGVPPEAALQGFEEVRAFSAAPERSAPLLERLLGARPAGDARWELRGDRRGAVLAYDAPPAEHGRPGAGTVHHVAWGTTVDEHPHWQDRLAGAGVRTSGIIDRHYFHSIYFREPSGVLFEIADDGPGFTVDVPLERLGSEVILPPQLEPSRDAIEARLTPLPDPRAAWTRG